MVQLNIKIACLLDALLNVLFPLALGCLVYFTGTAVEIASTIKNYLPDGLWAYAFISSVLITRRRSPDIFWIILTFLLAASVELMQYLDILMGTADIVDLLVYSIGITAGIYLNTYFRRKSYQNK